MGMFLYGFSAKSIQNYILQSDKLQEIVGASLLVQGLCATYFEQAVNEFGVRAEILSKAAGQARMLIDDEAKVRAFYRYWPVIAARYAPGLHVVQAMVSIEKGKFSEANEELERALDHERYSPIMEYDEVGPCVALNPRSGLPSRRKITRHGAQVSVDSVGDSKLQAYKDRLNASDDPIMKSLTEPDNTQPYKDIGELAGEGEYVAVAHADGNNMGIAISRLVEATQKAKLEVAKSLSGFSKAIDCASRKAAQEAFNKVIESEITPEGFVPIRSIALGGDDLTVLIRADLAIQYMNIYLQEFKRLSKCHIEKNLPNGLPKEAGLEEGISACAGIAFVQRSYPFHAANELAELLCATSKNAGRKLSDGNAEPIPSSMMFYRVTDSMTGDLERFTKPHDGIGFQSGPYHVEERDIPGMNSLTALEELAEALIETSPGTARKIITTIYQDPTKAKDIARRDFRRMALVQPNGKRKKLEDAVAALTKDKDKEKPWDGDGNCPFQDALTIIKMRKPTDAEADEEER